MLTSVEYQTLRDEIARLRAELAQAHKEIEGRDYATEFFRERLCNILGLDYEHQGGTDDVITAIEKLRTKGGIK